MSDAYFSKSGPRFNTTAVGTNAGGTATIAAVAGWKMSVTGIQVSGDAAAVVTIESPANTVIWKKRYAAAFAGSETFPLGTVMGASGAAALVKISASTANCEANIQAISLVG